MSQRDQLVEELSVKLDILTKKYLGMKERVEKLEQTESLLREQNNLLQSNIHDMKSAELFSLGTGDIRETRKNISRLIKEIDKCIALLSV